jgi:iron complex outermembrane receptor protein
MFFPKRSCLILTVTLLGVPGPLLAQSRSNENAITQAEDAFGLSVGKESIGIYSADNTRGFSPTMAGNVRLEGLYFDPAFNLPSVLVDSVSIKVGTSALGYPFPAPSGIVDIGLRKPAAKDGASVTLNADQFGSVGVEVDGSAKSSDNLSIAYGLAVNHVEYPDGTHNHLDHEESLVARWRVGNAEIIPFWELYNNYGDEAGYLLAPAGSYLPKSPPIAQYKLPSWSAFRRTAANLGILGSLPVGKDWLIRLGAFRSILDHKRDYANILAGEAPDGSGEWEIVADPRSKDTALSGELRITHRIDDGPRLHLVHLSLREHATWQHYGGSDMLDFGPGRVDQVLDVPKPDLEFGPLSQNKVQQSTIGIAYDGRWKNVGELSAGVSRASFRQTTSSWQLPDVVSRSQPWLYNGSLAIQLAKTVSAYAGFSRGLEASGAAPFDAANRNQPLPVILTQQKDAGVSFKIAGGLKLIGGIFDLRRPYFGYASGRIYTQVGSIESKGAEISASGSLTKQLDIVAGGVFLKPKVTPDPDAEGVIGSKPVGLASRYANVNVNWRTPLKGIELDLNVKHQGRTPSTTDNLVFLPASTIVSPGSRYRFRLAGKQATLRLELYNAFNTTVLNIAGPGLYGVAPHRYVLGYLTVDI